MPIKKMKDGRWCAYYSKRHPITKKPISLRRIRKSKKEAAREDKEIIALIHERCKETLLPRWKEHCENYFNSMLLQDYAAKTINDYSSCIRKYTYKDWGRKFINDISSHEIRGLVKSVGETKSKGHQKNILKFIRGAFNHALERGVLEHNPTPRMKIKINSKVKRVLTTKEQKFFLEKAKEFESEWVYVWALACYTGMRTGELYALKWEHIQLEGEREERMVTICSRWTKQDGFKDYTKSGDDRKVPISENLEALLLKIKQNVHAGEFVLPKIRKWTSGYQAEELRFFLTGIGLPEIRFHDLRAGWATRLLVDGVKPIVVMRMGGWKDLKTMQRYIRMSGVDIEGGIDSINF